ncbi:MAG: hypothetical protein ACYTEQ_30645 [Planctomycetota bacterium]|jgi:hypothetical protein
MARDLTTPQTQTLVDKQVVTDVAYHLELPGGGVDMQRSTLRYKVTNFAGTTPKTVAERSVKFADLPPVVKTKMKELHALVMTDADNNGLLSPGTDADDF